VEFAASRHPRSQSGTAGQRDGLRHQSCAVAGTSEGCQIGRPLSLKPDPAPLCSCSVARIHSFARTRHTVRPGSAARAHSPRGKVLHPSTFSASPGCVQQPRCPVQHQYVCVLITRR
jgi:hypothetical protein